MKSNPEVSKLLVETGAFTDLDNPVILTSGELGIYYINTEKLLKDGGVWKGFGDSSADMIRHAIKTDESNPNFERVIDVLATTTSALMNGPAESYVISGGQRRDWLFSGPVAHRLGLPHVSLYKDGRMEVVNTNTGSVQELSDCGKPKNAIHIVDLVTEASSVYRTEDGVVRGWVPLLRGVGIDVNNLITVVDRKQGGREILGRVGVELYSHVVIDKQFAREHSGNPERAIAYMKDPSVWSEAYLREHGALAFVKMFDPDSGNSARAGKFLDRYGKVLADAGKMGELKDAVKAKYNIKVKDIKWN